MKSYAKLISSMLIWGTLPVFVSKVPCSSAETVMWRILFGLAFLLIVFIFAKNKADKAMYESKNTGKNKITLSF